MKSSVILWVILCSTTKLLAIPEYMLLTGNRCVNCHVNAQGSGLRNALGFYTTEGVSLIKPEWLGLQGIVSDFLSTNTILDTTVTLGLDFRMMSVRSATPRIQPGSLPDRKLFPMQASAYLAFQPMTWMFVEGQYNFGRSVYTGQQSWSGSLNVQPNFELPAIRLGFFQPSIGVRYDDHTFLVRQQIALDPGLLAPYTPQSPLIAPNYAEWGAELRYSTPLWLDASVGIFSTKNLSGITLTDTSGRNMTTLEFRSRSIIADDAGPLLNARIAVTPRFFDDQINLNLGASVLFSGDFSMVNVFYGIGWQDHLCLLTEYMRQGNQNQRQLKCFSAELMWKIIDPLYVYVRADHGRNESVLKGTSLSYTINQFVVGTQMFVLPFIEIRPEYRITDSDEFYRSRWAIQLHVFY